MDIEKLIEQLRNEAATFRPNSFAQTMLLDAATALSTLQIENQALRNAANGFKAENAQLRHRLSEAVSACSRIAEWAQDTGHDYVEGIARDFLDGEGNRP